MNAEKVRVFDKAYVSDQSFYVERQVSLAVSVLAETMVLQGSVINLAGTDTFVTFQAEGSYDGQTWLTTGMPSALTFTTKPAVSATSATAIDYPFVRVRATVVSKGTFDGEALFNVDLVFTHQ